MLGVMERSDSRRGRAILIGKESLLSLPLSPNEAVTPPGRQAPAMELSIRKIGARGGIFFEIAARIGRLDGTDGLWISLRLAQYRQQIEHFGGMQLAEFEAQRH